MQLLISQSFVFIRTNGFIKNPGVGGTKQLNFDIIHRLKPDLIIANKEENVKKQAEELANRYPVWTSPVNNLQDAYEMIEQTGMLTDKAKKSKEITADINMRFSQLPTPGTLLPTTYLIWQKHYMTVGGDTFIHSMLEAQRF